MCGEYPFLIPRDPSDGHRLTDDKMFWDAISASDEYNFETTLLDDLPAGWKKAFGESLCLYLKDALEQSGNFDDYVVYNAGRRLGRLLWVDNCNDDRVRSVIDRYADMSAETCCVCGERADVFSVSERMPYCRSCCPPGKTEPLRRGGRNG